LAAEWSVLIADDEPAARRGVRQLLAAHPDFAVVGECRDGAEVLAALETARPDVVFLDVQMPGLDGFEVIGRRTPERMPALVFLTAYDQFALRAFEAQALDYLLKPVTEARFAATMARLTRHLRAIASLPREAAITVATPRGAQVIPVDAIDWVESADNYARIWARGRGYLLRESMRTLEQRLRPQGFVRAHRRALVRLAAVRSLLTAPDGDSSVVLASGARVPLARRRRAAFAKALKRRDPRA
jgi:two-component system, LytTR family, response regulator